MFQLIPNNTRKKGLFPVSPASAGVTQILAADPKPGVRVVLQGAVRSFKLFPGSNTMTKLMFSAAFASSAWLF